MPTIAAHMQKKFKLTIEDGMPQATVETVGTERWLMCCPLCGSMHQLQGVDESAPYTPLCQTIPMLFKAQQLIWRKEYPDAANYTNLHLVSRTS
jgi:hypothetical protein